MKKNNIKEVDFIVTNSNDAQTLASTNKLKPEDKVYVDKMAKSPISEDDVLDPEAVIAPQDSATIKYLSNVVDDKTGDISQPFTIGAQKYQIIRGLAGDGQIVMAVFAHDETDDEGNNKIYTNEEFEANIALPARKLQEEGEAMEEPTLRGSNIQVVPEAKKDTYEGRRHFLIKKGTNEVRSFSSIKEMLECGKLEDEQ